MNKFILPLLLLVVLVATGCSEKFDVAAPYKNVTVIYGLLRQSDTAHYVRVQKAFLDQDKSAIDMAKVPDSSFYSNIRVIIKRYTAQKPAKFMDSFQLQRVNLDNEGYPKQPGAFFQSPNYAYKFIDSLDPALFYRIVVTNLVTGEKDSADAPIIADKNSPLFSVRLLDEFNLNILGLSFQSVQPTKTLELTGAYAPPSGYSFNDLSNPAGVSQAIVRFHYVDSDISAGTKVWRYADYDAGLQSMNKPSFTYRIPNNALYFALRNGMGTAPANIIRLLGRAELIFYLGTHDFYNYYQVSQTTGTGITGSEIQPVYTNVKGSNGIGLFTSRAIKSGFITIEKHTVDSLIKSPILSGANLRGTAY